MILLLDLLLASCFAVWVWTVVGGLSFVVKFGLVCCSWIVDCRWLRFGWYCVLVAAVYLVCCFGFLDGCLI